MTLTTHAIVGAALSTAVPNYPVLGFMLGFGSHFIFDAIPHWQESLGSVREDVKNPLDKDMLLDKKALIDLVKIGTDGILGLALSFILLGGIYHNSFLPILMGALGGMMPDALQFVYWKWRHEPLTSLQKLHIWVHSGWIHSNISLEDKPFWGILSQVLIICATVFIFK